MLDMSSCVTSCRHVAVAAVTLFAWPVSPRQAATAAEQSARELRKVRSETGGEEAAAAVRSGWRSAHWLKSASKDTVVHYSGWGFVQDRARDLDGHAAYLGWVPAAILAAVAMSATKSKATA